MLDGSGTLNSIRLLVIVLFRTGSLYNMILFRAHFQPDSVCPLNLRNPTSKQKMEKRQQQQRNEKKSEKKKFARIWNLEFKTN